MPTAYENTVDTLREVGERLAHDAERLAHDLPSNIPSPRIPSHLVPSALVPSHKRSGVLRQHPLLVAGAAMALIVAVVVLVRRRRSDDVDQALRVADGSKASSAA